MIPRPLLTNAEDFSLIPGLGSIRKVAQNASRLLAASHAVPKGACQTSQRTFSAVAKEYERVGELTEKRLKRRGGKTFDEELMPWAWAAEHSKTASPRDVIRVEWPFIGQHYLI
jgi:hypothetical protein